MKLVLASHILNGPGPGGVHVGPYLVLLVLLGALVYGGVRLGRRRRANRAPLPEPRGRHVQPVAPEEPGAAGPDAGGPVAAGPAPRPLPVMAGAAATESPGPQTSGSPPWASTGSFDVPADGWAVEAHGLTKRFGSNVAVDEVELRVPRGSAYGYLGPNGAGKTTLIRTLLGLTRANSGTMSLRGIPVPAERRRALARVGAIVDEPRFHAHLTGRQNLLILAAARGSAAKERIAPSLARVGLADRADEKVATYSMGMRQRLGVAACLLSDPELLVLDEPMNGLDPAGMHEMREMIGSLVKEGRTVVLSSHLLDEVERTCDAVAIVDHGRVIRQGPIGELTRGAGALVVQVDCTEPATAARLIEEAGIALGTVLTSAGLAVTLPAGATREAIADVNERLVRGGIAVYGLREVQTSLEDWFLSVTSRLGEN